MPSKRPPSPKARSLKVASLENNVKQPKLAHHLTTHSPIGESPIIPTFDLSCIDGTSAFQFLRAYGRFKAVHVKASSVYRREQKYREMRKEKEISWKDLGEIFRNLNQEDKESWCIENDGKNLTKMEERDIYINGNHHNQNHDHRDMTSLSPESFLRPLLTTDRAYCSFLIQKDTSLYASTVLRLPVQDLPWITVPPSDATSGSGESGDTTMCSYQPCLWVFFGRNHDGRCPEPLQGRPPHTDAVSHDGTWHYQLSGVKEWVLSPSSELLRYWKATRVQHKEDEEKEKTSTLVKESGDEVQLDWNTDTKIRVQCNQGDILVVNTRLWIHQTSIPYQEYPSVSYARDFMLNGCKAPECDGDQHAIELYSKRDGDPDAEHDMTNVDGLYATDNIETGMILFTEADMPDCALHRSKDNPNCEVVQLEDGSSAVVACRDIACGEFFCVAESDDEDEGDDNNDDEEEDACDGNDTSEEECSEEEGFDSG